VVFDADQAFPVAGHHEPVDGAHEISAASRRTCRVASGEFDDFLVISFYLTIRCLACGDER
jgi:hypothetical protein